MKQKNVEEEVLQQFCTVKGEGFIDGYGSNNDGGIQATTQMSIKLDGGQMDTLQTKDVSRFQAKKFNY